MLYCKCLAFAVCCVSLVQSQTGSQAHGLSQATPGHGNSLTSSPRIERGTSDCRGSRTKLRGFSLLPGLGYYKFHTDASLWPRAREVCQVEGGHLLILNSEQETQAMMQLFAQNPNIVGASNKSYVWVGVKESETVNGEYATIFGKPLATTGFTRWDNGEPNESTPGDYIWMKGATGGLGDRGVAYNYKFAFICEHRLC